MNGVIREEMRVAVSFKITQSALLVSLKLKSKIKKKKQQLKVLESTN